MDDFDDEGNAAELEFGKEFAQDVQFLMNDEVYILLHLLGNDMKSRGNSMNGGGVANETFSKTYQYTSRVAISSDPEILKGVATELRKGLTNMELIQKIDGQRAPLHMFEVAQLANLIPQNSEDIDETIAWLPSMARFEDESILEVLNLINRAKSRINSNF